MHLAEVHTAFLDQGARSDRSAQPTATFGACPRIIPESGFAIKRFQIGAYAVLYSAEFRRDGCALHPQGAFRNPVSWYCSINAFSFLYPFSTPALNSLNDMCSGSVVTSAKCAAKSGPNWCNAVR